VDESLNCRGEKTDLHPAAPTPPPWSDRPNVHAFHTHPSRSDPREGDVQYWCGRLRWAKAESDEGEGRGGRG